MPQQRTTGLTAKQSTTLITALNSLEQAKPKVPQAHPGPSPNNHTHQLPENLTQKALAHLFEVSQPTISWTIPTVNKALTNVGHLTWSKT